MSSIIKVNTVQDTDGNNIINENADTITIGASGDTISIPAGATIANSGTSTGFASIAWQSSIVTAATLTAVAGRGYWIDTTSNTVTVTLPSSASVGDELWFIDYARNFATNNLIINTNSLKFQGAVSTTIAYKVNGTALNIVYSGATKGWIPTEDDPVDNAAAYAVQYLVVAGGGGGGFGYTGGYYAGGGGAGGYRNSYASETSGRNSTTETPVEFVNGIQYTITVGAAGAAGASNGLNGSNGGDSSISGTGLTTITSIGGGFGMGGNTSAGSTAGAGGSGGGGADGVNYTTGTGGSGTAGQGFDGGTSTGGNEAAGGGGAAAIGAFVTGGSVSAGGAGLSSSITGSAVTRSVGGNGTDASPASKTANRGEGGDASKSNTTSPTSGSSGVVILRVLTSDYSGTTTGSPTVTTDGSDTIITFNASGSYTA